MHGAGHGTANTKPDASGLACGCGFITAGQARDVASKYLREHPEQGHYAAWSVIQNRLVEVWPCK
jgi:hypothetical protein